MKTHRLWQRMRGSKRVQGWLLRLRLDGSLWLAVVVWSALAVWILGYDVQGSLEPRYEPPSRNRVEEFLRQDIEVDEFSVEVLQAGDPRFSLKAGRGKAGSGVEGQDLQFVLTDGVIGVYSAIPDVNIDEEQHSGRGPVGTTVVQADKGIYTMHGPDEYTVELRDNVRVERRDATGRVLDLITTDWAIWNSATDLISSDSICQVTSEQHGRWASEGLQFDPEITTLSGQLIPVLQAGK